MAKQRDRMGKTCVICKERMPYARPSEHFREKHPEYEWTHERKVGCVSSHYYCSLCGMLLTGFPHLVRHYREFHRAEIDKHFTPRPPQSNVEQIRQRIGQIREDVKGREQAVQNLDSVFNEEYVAQQAKRNEQLSTLPQAIGSAMARGLMEGAAREPATKRDPESINSLSDIFHAYMEKPSRAPVFTESTVTVSELDRLLEQVDRNVELMQELRAKNQELIWKCTNYAARIVELQNDLARDNAGKRY